MATKTSLPKETKENKTKISLKLLVDMKSKKVLFAEAGKDFVDFLFSLLQIPFGTIIALLKNQEQQQSSTNANANTGSFFSLYDSVNDLDPTYFQSAQEQESLLKPKSTASSSTTNTPPMLTDLLTKNVDKNYDVAVAKKEVGFVKGVVTYMVMDDLEVKPMSTISSISLINSFQVKDVSKLVEWNVDVDNKKAIELVKAMLDSNRETVLTNVFFPSKQVSPTPLAPAV